jgi:hypothetical protein
LKLRKWNAVLSAVLLLLFAAHGVVGSVLLLGIGTILIKPLARGLFVVAAIHTIIGIILTVQSCSVWHRTKSPYLKNNSSFWIRRLSGIAIGVLMCLHLSMFGHTPSGTNQAWILDLILQLLLVGSILIHIVCNVKPMLVAFGCKAGLKQKGIVIAVFSAIIAFCGSGMIVYYVG